MRVLGLDIGSRTVEGVWVEDGRLLRAAVLDSGFDPQGAAASLVARDGHDRIVATGYGRRLAGEVFGADVVTEIRAYAVGAHAVFPQAAGVLDIGGQDTKAIALGSDGRVADFEMNDKCAAGTGKFLEVMAGALGFTLDEMAAAALATTEGATISSMCTVFAESEVTGLVHRGEDRGRIARGLHQAVATRTLASLGRVRPDGPLVFAGGVARNPAMVALIRAGVADDVLVPDEPQTLGAFGAALCCEAPDRRLGAGW
jgi:(R)-2-hydroxyacyl-CoA dehydratese activating ATPase